MRSYSNTRDRITELFDPTLRPIGCKAEHSGDLEQQKMPVDVHLSSGLPDDKLVDKHIVTLSQ